MLNKLEIKQFKCFNQTEIHFKALTILAGANGVGKSSVIQALLLLNQLYRYSHENKIYISINDKIQTFLELGSTNEILNSNALTSTITFIAYDENNHSEQADFEVEKTNSLSLRARLFNATIVAELPFQSYIHYLNAERLGPRNTQSLTVQQYLNVGYQGEYTGQAIDEASKRIFKVPENRQNPFQKVGLGFDRQVEAWMNFILPDIEINIEPYLPINQVRIGIRKKGAGTPFLHPNNIGFGISYVLPIVVSGLVAEKNSLFIIENPEAHLHPLGQSRVGQFLAIIAGAGVQVIVETHSEHVINGIRISSLKNHISYDQVLVNFFDQNNTNEVSVKSLNLNNKGELDEWPAGFFDQEEKDLTEIFRLNRSSI